MGSSDAKRGSVPGLPRRRSATALPSLPMMGDRPARDLARLVRSMSQVPAPNPANTPMPEIPGYRLESVLGRGATGTVYRAVQLAVERTVAIKVLHPELAGSKAVRRLQREARTTARLAHPGIVSAIDMGQVGGLWWYAMELVDGPALSAVLREKGRLSEREALKLFIPLCEALEHAHEHGVVHRDIKPANILVDAHGRARLVDLGLAFTEDDPLLTRTGGTLGTPHYLSPEQARNPQGVDVRSDIWSLGASMYHAMCGRPPFAGESVAEILSGVLYAHIPDPRDLEPSLSAGMGLVLRKCLTRNADRRYATPSELLRDLEALRERRAVAVSSRGLDPVAGERERRRRNWAIAGVVALLAGVIATILWKPWAASEPPGAHIASETRWPVLDEVLAEAAVAVRRAPGTALEKLDRMKESVPPEHSQAYYTVRASVQQRFEAAVREERQRIGLEFDKALTQSRDFVRAAALVSREVEERLASEFGASEEQRLAVQRQLDLGSLREQAADGERQALERFLEQLNAHYDEVVIPMVRNAQKNGAWREARGLIQRDVRAVLPAAGIDTHGMTPSKVDEQIKLVQLVKIKSEASALSRAWQELDYALEKSLLARKASIEQRLRGRELEGDAAAAIQAGFAEELAERSLAPEQMLVDVSDLAHAALNRAGEELAELQTQLEGQDARDELAAQEEQLAASWKERRYAEIAAVWEKRLGEQWLAPVHKELELRIAEARLLAELLVRAGAGLTAPGTNSLLIGTIECSGRIEVLGSDPLQAGFRFTFAGRTETYVLCAPSAESRALLLGKEGFERLAGLANDSKDEHKPIDRLLRALFRLREGDPEAALKAFNSGPLPLESHGALVADLDARLAREGGALSAKAKRREDEAQRAYNLIQRAHQRDPAERIRRIDNLLTQYGDCAVVRENDAKLRELRQQLAQSGKQGVEAQIQAMYAPTRLSLPQSGRARMEFSCSTEKFPAWEMGDWRNGPEGWSAEGRHSRTELETETLWPRLLLERSFDLGARVDVELEFEQPGPPNRFVASVAGVHIAFAGPAEIGGQGLVSASAGGPTALRDLLDSLDRGVGKPIGGLVRGQTHVLRLVLVQGRGKLEASLDGQLVLEQDFRRPEGKGGSSSVVVRSIEPVLLKAVRIEAGLSGK